MSVCECMCVAHECSKVGRGNEVDSVLYLCSYQRSVDDRHEVEQGEHGGGGASVMVGGGHERRRVGGGRAARTRGAGRGARRRGARAHRHGGRGGEARRIRQLQLELGEEGTLVGGARWLGAACTESCVSDACVVRAAPELVELSTGEGPLAIHSRCFPLDPGGTGFTTRSWVSARSSWYSTSGKRGAETRSTRWTQLATRRHWRRTCRPSRASWRTPSAGSGLGGGVYVSRRRHRRRVRTSVGGAGEWTRRGTACERRRG